MNIAIISDIHGNIDALRKVLSEIDKLKIDKILVLGDLLGYYYFAEEVYKELIARNSIIIKGNHENIFLDYIERPQKRTVIDHKYGSSFSTYMKNFDDYLISYIKNLPEKYELSIATKRILMAHGSPFDKDFYVYPDCDELVLKQCFDNNADYVFIGHTHYPFVTTYKNKLLCNVGSVGQSRVVGGIANWGVLSLDNDVYIPKASVYDTTRLEKEIKKRDMSHPYLAKILKRGR